MSVVETWRLAEITQAIIERRGGIETWRGKTGAEKKPKGASEESALGRLAIRLAAAAGITEEAALRRLGLLRSAQPSITTSSGHADELLLALDAPGLRLDSIPHFFPTRPEAKEAVDVYHDLNGETVTELEAAALAGRLLRISRAAIAELKTLTQAPDSALNSTAAKAAA